MFKTEYADLEYFTIVMEYLEKQPSIQLKQLVCLDDGWREKIAYEMKRANTKAARIITLLNEQNKCPVDLTVPIIDSWFFKRNEKFNTYKADLEYVVAAYDCLKVLSARPRINLNENGIRERFIDLKEKTNLSAPLIIKGLQMINRCPVGLTANVINKWTSKNDNGNYKLQTADLVFFDAVILFLEKKLNPGMANLNIQPV